MRQILLQRPREPSTFLDTAIRDLDTFRYLDYHTFAPP